MNDIPRTIHADELTEATGLTDRRHRQLANAGWFPPPKKGEYEYKRTIQGLLCYYREKDGKLSPLGQKKLEKLGKEIGLLEIKLDEARRSFIDVDTVCQLWRNFSTAMRRLILSSALSDGDKARIVLEIDSSRLDDPRTYQGGGQDPAWAKESLKSSKRKQVE